MEFETNLMGSIRQRKDCQEKGSLAFMCIWVLALNSLRNTTTPVYSLCNSHTPLST